MKCEQQTSRGIAANRENQNTLQYTMSEKIARKAYLCQLMETRETTENEILVQGACRMDIFTYLSLSL